MSGKPTGTTDLVKAMSIMVIAMILAPGMDAIAKYLATRSAISPASVTLGRFVVQSILLFGFVAVAMLKTGSINANFRINVLRGMIMGFASMLFFVAVKYMPLADCIAIFFVEPLILMLLSSIFLGEVVGWRRRIAAVVGLCGALIVIQPSYELFGPISLLPLSVAFLFSVYLILTRKMGKGDDPIAMQFCAGIGGVIMCASLVGIGTTLGAEDFSFTLPTTNTAIALVLLIGVFATVCHLLLVIAFSMAPASILAPFQYIEIIGATILGFFIFSDFPSPIKWVGISIIIASGIYTFVRERQLEKTENVGA